MVNGQMETHSHTLSRVKCLSHITLLYKFCIIGVADGIVHRCKRAMEEAVEYTVESSGDSIHSAIAMYICN